jgi:type II secretion system protein C
MGRLGIRMVNTALFVLCSYLAASVFNEISAELLTPPPSAARPPTSRESLSRPDWNDRKAILDRNLFRAQVTGEQLPPVDSEEKLAETKLPLRLLGTAASPDPSLSSAAIEDLSSHKHEVVRIGDRLESHARVEVAGIERRRVILQNGDRREELVLEDEQPGARPRAHQTARRAPPQRERPRTRLSQRLEELRDRATGQDTGGRSPSSLFSEARILPKYENGEMVGIQLNAIKPGSVYEKFGFRDGDVITELNGIRVDNPGASAQLLRELSEADEFVFEKKNASGTEKFTVPADEVARVLGEM